ncbi:MAG: DAK2 domain-containing protein [Mollicutes bacterium]|nr:DAK2 domain-containing protein [Mollicutes bacterium]
MNTLNGTLYKQLILNGLNNLSIHCKEVNDLNVFPVPDGDTGTNMLMTLQNGYSAISGVDKTNLSEIAMLFSKSAVLGARGNSGVILSQFLKGICNYFSDYEEVGAIQFIHALEKGVEYAYKAVAIPVEGTMLTVMREATEYVAKCIQGEKIATIDQIISLFINQAKVSLENTPNLLHVLKSAGVIDSGGAGLIYIFEGMDMSIKGEIVEPYQSNHQAVYVDYSIFNSHSKFEFGYCTELLIQLLSDKVDVEKFDINDFTEVLGVFGNSIVTSLNDDKVKVHIHTHTPEKVLDYCHTYGEFLALKIENMDVQHDNKVQETTKIVQPKSKKEEAKHQNTASVVVASDKKMAQLFESMGASYVIYGGDTCNPSVSDFVDAYSKVNADNIIVFPNNSNVILTVNQSAQVFNKSNIICIETKSYLECYSALTLIDYELANIAENIEAINDAIKNITSFIITKSVKDSSYENSNIHKDDYIAIKGKDLLGISTDLIELTVDVATKLIKKEKKDIMTIFVGKNVSEEDIKNIKSRIHSVVGLIDIDVIETDNNVHNLMISLE